VGIEGIDAAGKRTQTALLARALRASGLGVGILAFPDYSTPVGKEIETFLSGRRDYTPRVRHILFAANRWEKHDEIERQLSSNDVLIVDRYSESNLAYGVASGLPLKWLVNLEEGLPKTDIVFVLDASPSSLFGRRKGRDRYESDVSLQQKARESYLSLAKQFGWRVINASQSIDKTHNLLLGTLTSLLRAKGRTI
jgi:dTMP kinase